MEGLRETGIHVFEEPLPIFDMLRELPLKPLFNAHVKAQSDGSPIVGRGNAEVICHDPADVVAAPGMIDLALKFAPAAREYLGQECFVYSMNAFWTWPGNSAPIAYLQEFHRDHDDEKFLALFIYGTDVLDEDAGPHQVINKGSDGVYRPLSIYGPGGTAIEGLGRLCGQARYSVPSVRGKLHSAI